VLYAPTFRDKEPTKLFPFSEFEDFGREQEGVTAQREEAMCQNKNISDSQEKLISWLEQEQIFLCIRMHLYDQTGYEWLKKLDVPGSRIRFLNEDRQGDIMEILNVFDLLVTDYSSIYIDYLLTGKPIVFLPYDQEKYLQERGMNFPYEKVTPGPKPKSLQEFLNSIHDLLYNHDGYVRQRADINDFFNTVQSPCCENICNYVRKIAAIEYK
ncbi:MAG: hypothetical protein EOM18_11045, partial [Clostridia bacterium]|nr:hypothetical protein [Clostridia bacterium]